jgi:hypothetical protein
MRRICAASADPFSREYVPLDLVGDATRWVATMPQQEASRRTSLSAFHHLGEQKLPHEHPIGVLRSREQETTIRALARDGLQL